MLDSAVVTIVRLGSPCGGEQIIQQFFEAGIIRLASVIFHHALVAIRLEEKAGDDFRGGLSGRERVECRRSAAGEIFI